MAHPGIDVLRQLLESSGMDRGTVQERRAAMEALAPAAPPEGVTVESATVGGRPAEWLQPIGPTPVWTVLYLHGGGYCIGSPATHRDLAGRIALAAGCRVCTIDYRLAPEHPFPAALDDAVEAYLELLDQTDAAHLAIAGDSAGGGLTVATLLALRAANVALPAAAVCLSPWADLTQSGDAYGSRADVDVMLTKERLDELAGYYLVDVPGTEPLASPVFGDLTGLPPLLIEVGDAEVLVDDAQLLATRAREAGVDVTLTVWPDMIHVFQAFPANLLPESAQSVDVIGAFLRKRLTVPA
jgi:epsilon-lactone hydrolase